MGWSRVHEHFSYHLQVSVQPEDVTERFARAIEEHLYMTQLNSGS